MNPLNIKTHKQSDQSASPYEDAGTLLRQHGYDTTVKDRLLQVALAEESKQHFVGGSVTEDDDGHTHEPLAPHLIDPDDHPAPPDDTPPNLHRDICIVPNFLSTDICDEYIEYIRQQQEVDLSVFNPDEANRTGQIAWEIDKKTRDTQTVDIEPIKSVVLELMQHAVRDVLNPFFNVTVKDSELPQILVYHPGGHYRPHIDAEALFNDNGELKWVKNVDRDISMVLYLNDDYDGGEIVFPKQALSVKPRKGMLVAFPSSHHFLHGVNPVVTGTRYAIVNWFSLGTIPVFNPEF